MYTLNGKWFVICSMKRDICSPTLLVEITNGKSQITNKFQTSIGKVQTASCNCVLKIALCYLFEV